MFCWAVLLSKEIWFKRTKQISEYNHSCLPILGLWEPKESKVYIAM